MKFLTREDWENSPSKRDGINIDLFLNNSIKFFIIELKNH